MTGPVQVLVVGVTTPDFSGEVMGELARLREAGIVRLLDVLLVTRSPDGAFHTLTPPGFLPAGTGSVVARLVGEPDGSTGDPASGVPDGSWSLADVVPVGTTAAIALIEHLWAGPLRDAIQRAGGLALQETWLAPDDVRTLDQLLAEGDSSLVR